ncbi:hypothetical protein G9A89_018813 [Geosiphon pyriformis]|nr:hypothetical protein G9A89_018813 [Geosiphon pyriformis]
MEGSRSALPSVLDPDMDVDAKVFYWKYGKDYPSATFEQWDAAYNEYKDFYAKYHQDNPGATTNCYEEYLKTKQVTPSKRKFENEISTQAHKRQFERPYSDPTQMRRYFMDKLDEIVRTWDPREQYAPMTAIVQSSGVGKSRIIREVAQERYVFYCCLRPSLSTGFPPRSAIADELLSDEARNCKSYVAYLLACMQVFVDIMQQHSQLISPAAWFDWHVFGTPINENSSSSHDYWIRVRTYLHEHTVRLTNVEQFPMELLVMARKLARVLKASKDPEARIVFVFDEARNINTPRCNGDVHNHFYWLRYALRMLPSHNSGANGEDTFTAAVFLDTSSRVGDFVPPALQDPSARIAQNNLDVFSPFYLVSTFDSLADRAPVDSLATATKEDRLISLGRPLWKTIYDSATAPQADTIALAIYKIMCTNEVLTADKLTLEQTLAILSPRIALDVNPSLRINTALIADHMRVCIHITPERESVLSAVPSEPILAEASAQLMHRQGYLESILSFLAVSLRYGIVDAGYRGELVAQLLVLLAIDHVSTRRGSMPYSRVVTVSAFLSELLGVNCANLDTIMDTVAKDRLMRGEIFLTHFVRPTYKKPNRATLYEFAIRGAGIFSKRYSEAVDLIIPVVLPPDTAESSLTVRPNKTITIPLERISFILVQVKNRKKQKIGEQSRSHLAPQKLGLIDSSTTIPYGALWMELGILQNTAQEMLSGCGVHHPVERTQLGLKIIGLNTNVYPCIADDSYNRGIAKLLVKILQSWPEPAQLASGDAYATEAVKSILRLQYLQD